MGGYGGWRGGAYATAAAVAVTVVAAAYVGVACAGAVVLPYPRQRLTYYAHVERGGPSMRVLLPAIDPSRTADFGWTVLFALNLTASPSNASKPLGFARGFTIDAAYTPKAYAGFESEIISFNNGHYRGTIHLQALLDGVGTSEVAVLGGTGSFRGATGYGFVSQWKIDLPYVVYKHTLHFTHNCVTPH